MISTVISVVALGVSIFVLVDGRRLDRRDLLLKLHEQLNDQDRSTGRRLLYQLAGQPVESWPDDQFDRANGALAYFDVIGMYADLGYVKKDDVLRPWAEPGTGRGRQRSRSSTSGPDRAVPGHGHTSRGWPRTRRRNCANVGRLW